MNGDIEDLMSRAASLGSSGAAARQHGEEAVAEASFRDALRLAVDAGRRARERGQRPAWLDSLRLAAGFALDCGEAEEARRLIAEALCADISAEAGREWARLRDPTTWPDSWLIAAVRLDPPDVEALDALANRHWKPLFARCQLLALDRQKAGDLAQEAWCRVLRARRSLKPGGNFAAYLTKVATNLWRDWYRSARRAGPMAENRLESLDAARPTDDGEGVALGESIVDLKTLTPEEQTRLAMDIDSALGHLNPQLREVLVARFINGESCAEIGKRFGRTEQSISGWVRQALREMRLRLDAACCGAAVKG